MSTFRGLAIGSAFLRMWRAWKIILPTILVNALLQAILLFANPWSGETWLFWPLVVLSFLIFVKAAEITIRAMLDAAVGTPSWGSVIGSLRSRYWILALWALGLLAISVVGLSLYLLPGLLVMAALPYLLIAVVDGARNPLAANFRTIGKRWGQWLITLIVIAVFALPLWLGSGLDSFFITGSASAFFAWVVLGYFATWFLCAWSLIYRSVNPTP